MHGTARLGQGAQLQRVSQRWRGEREERGGVGRGSERPTVGARTPSAPPARAGVSAAAPRGRWSSPGALALPWFARLPGYTGWDLSLPSCAHHPTSEAPSAPLQRPSLALRAYLPREGRSGGSSAHAPESTLSVTGTSSGLSLQGLPLWAPISGDHQSLYLPDYPGPHSCLRGVLCQGAFLWATQMVWGSGESRTPSGGGGGQWQVAKLLRPGLLGLPSAQPLPWELASPTCRLHLLTEGHWGCRAREEGWRGRAASEQWTGSGVEVGRTGTLGVGSL